jgi:inorganic pyrophosphatase
MDLEKLSKGKNFPQEVNVVVEIPKGSPIKYEFDKESGFVTVDRFAYTAMAHPFNYGFVPHTHADDGDPADALVISTHPVNPGSVVPTRVIGMLEMEDEAGIDHKIIGVPTKKVDPFYANVEDIGDLGEAVQAQIKHFFEQYKTLEPEKWVKVGSFQGKKDAAEELEKSAKGE